MSKIQEALKKIQGKKSDADDDGHPVAVVTPLHKSDDFEAIIEAEEARQEDRVGIHYETFRETRHLAENPAQSLAISREFSELVGHLDLKAGAALVVTAPDAGCGRSYVAVNLAATLVEEHSCDVLLIDCDVGNPELTEATNRSGESGFFDVVAGKEFDIESVIAKSTIKGLSIMTIGTSPPDGVRHLELGEVSAALSRIMEKCDDKIIIIDYPELSAFADSADLPRFDERFLVVAAAGTTSKDDLESAVRRLRDAQVELLLNQR